MQEPRHEASAHILEGKRGAMEEFERVDVRLDLDNRRVEREGVVDDASEVVGRNILAEERVGHAVGYFLKRELGHLVPKRGGQLLDDLGHIEPLVLRESADDSLAQRGATGFVVCAVVEHDRKTISLSPILSPVREGSSSPLEVSWLFAYFK